MEIIKVKAKAQREIFADILADALHIPEDVKNDLMELSHVEMEIHKRMSENQAINHGLIGRYNSLCYKCFPKEQDGEEFTKEEPEAPKTPVHLTLKKESVHPVRDTVAMDIVHNYIIDHLDKSDPEVPNFEVFIVWKCKALQNWKWLLASTLPDGMYYELTFNGDKGEYYLDAYRKVENKVIREGTLE